MDLNETAIKTITSEIVKCVKTLIQNCNFDKTVKAKVIFRLDDYKYKVNINGSEYTGLCSGTLNENDIVYATIVQGNYNQILLHLPVLQKGL